MKKISVFNFVTVDGFFAGPNGEIDWFKLAPEDDEFERYSRRGSQAGDTLVFGRATYEMMKSYWPTPAAIEADPAMSRVMNENPKIVFSRTLPGIDEGPVWKNVRLFREISKDDVLALKERVNMTILGSGTIIRQFANLGLIDEYVLTVVPVVLGEGRPLFKDVARSGLNLVEAKAFRNGMVVLHYRAA